MSTIINATTTNGVVIQPDNSGSLVLQTNSGTTALTIDTSQRAAFVAGTAAAPAITTTGDTNTGMWFPAADTIAFAEGGAEAMRIDSSGNLLVGTTSPITSGKQTTSFNGATFNGLILSESANTSDAAFIGFNNGATNIGSISRVGATSAVVYSTTSDERLKSNIVNSDLVLDKLMQVQVRQYDWTEGNVHQEYGFIAQELEPVLSGIVTKGKTDDDMWQLDYSRLTPHLVKAIQEQQTIINDLKARIETLEAK